jgi:hypothetical protein
MDLLMEKRRNLGTTLDAVPCGAKMRGRRGRSETCGDDEREDETTMPSPILNKCRLYETRDDLRSHCNEPQMMRGEITFHDYEAGTAVLLTAPMLRRT